MRGEPRSQEASVKPVRDAVRDFLNKALLLSEAERGDLVEKLIESLDPPEEPEADIEAAWDMEIARRIQELDGGKARCIPWEEVRAGVFAKLNASPRD